MTEVCIADHKKIIRLCREIAEISTPEERIQHFLDGTMALTGTDILGIVAMTREGDHLRLGVGYTSGVTEWQASIVNDWYLEGGAYRTDPFNRAIAPKGLATLRRQDLLPNSEWYSHPHIEGLKSLHLDAVMASVRNLREQQVSIVARRNWGKPEYSDQERETLDLVAECLQWFFLDLEKNRYFGSPIRVPSKFDRIMSGLMRGLSEKEIAEEVHLSSRTVHKYVQELFRHCGVNSRSKLMALWSHYPNQTTLPSSVSRLPDLL